jgi:hypothetical protein
MSDSVLSVAPVPEPPDGPPASGLVLRPARAAIGWMRPDEAHRALQMGMAGPAPERIVETARLARDAVASRPAGVSQDDLVSPMPGELAGHVRALQASPAAGPMFTEGWQVQLVDLTGVCAFQPLLYSDRSFESTQLLDANDLTAIAAITLPLTQGDLLPVQYDPIRQAWIVTSVNMNLRIVGNVGPLPMPPGGSILGFGVFAGPSFMQVARRNGRYFLRDGNHRALWLLRRGISVVPAFVRDFTAFEELMPDPRALLPQDSYCGLRPPVLPDYLDDTFSAAVQAPDPRKIIIIQALELAAAG